MICCYIDYTRSFGMKELHERRYTRAEVPFYAGIGTLDRYRDRHRNAKHSRVVEQYGMRRRLVQTVSDRSVAELWEVRTIDRFELYSPGYELSASLSSSLGCNMTFGGEPATDNDDRVLQCCYVSPAIARSEIDDAIKSSRQHYEDRKWKILRAGQPLLPTVFSRHQHVELNAV